MILTEGWQRGLNKESQLNSLYLSNAAASFHLKGSLKDGRIVAVPIEDALLSGNLLCLGGTRSGKTNAISSFACQLRNNGSTEDSYVFFDTKGDYLQQAYKDGDEIYSIYTEAGYPPQEPWSLMAEVLADYYSPEDAVKELSAMLFKEQVDKSNQPFFPLGAQQVLSGLLISYLRGALQGGYCPSNKELLTLIKSMSTSVEAIHERFTRYPDLEYLRGIIPYTAGCAVTPQTLGVMAELIEMLDKTFVGNYQKEGTGSLRKTLRAKGGKAIFIEYDFSQVESSRSINKLLLDLAIKEALCRNLGNSRGRTYLFLDEFPLLPPLSYIANAVNFGGGLGVRIIAGVQSISQILNTYGEQGGKALLSGFSSLIAFRPNDEATRSYVSSYIGEEEVVKGYMSRNRLQGGRVELKREPVVSGFDLNSLQVGEAIVSLRGEAPFNLYFNKFR